MFKNLDKVPTFTLLIMLTLANAALVNKSGLLSYVYYVVSHTVGNLSHKTTMQLYRWE